MIEPKLMSEEELAGHRDDAEHGRIWRNADVIKFLGHIAALSAGLESITLEEHDHARALIVYLTDMQRDAQLRDDHETLIRARNMYGVFTKLLRLCGIIQ